MAKSPTQPLAENTKGVAEDSGAESKQARPDLSENVKKFYETQIGVGDECIEQDPDVGDYPDGDVSRPAGPLFEGPQGHSSAKLHGFE